MEEQQEQQDTLETLLEAKKVSAKLILDHLKCKDFESARTALDIYERLDAIVEEVYAVDPEVDDSCKVDESFHIES